MLKWIASWFKRAPLESFDQALSRERLIQASRILIIDDDEPLLVSELRVAGFSVDHDKTGEDTHNLDQQLYDLVILDYHGVGKRLGQGQGLELLRHIRRVTPRTRVMAYTSRSLSSTESDFFRLSHSVLPKDLGLGESLSRIEDELRKAFSKAHLFEALISKLTISDPIRKDEICAALTKALSKNDEGKFKEFLKKTAGSAAEKAVDLILARLFGGGK